MSETGEAATVRPCVEALAGRPEELGRALGGRSLLVLVAYPERPALRVMLTRSGVVSLVPLDQPFMAQVEVRGTAEQVRSFLTDRLSLGDAILTGVVTIRIPEDEARSYRELRALVAEVVDAC